VADANPVSAPKPPPIERLKSGAAVLGAIAGAVTGLWGVYEKVSTEAKELTARSYNTLAPQMNQIGEALKQLQQENQHLREILAEQSGKPRIAAEPPASSRRPPRRNVSAGSSSTAPPGSAANQPAAAAPAGAAPPAGTPAGTPAAPATAPSGAEPGAPPASAQAPPAAPQDPVTGLLNTVGRTREAIDGLRKVPESFENVLGKKK
jgi:hypothetical protein